MLKVNIICIGKIKEKYFTDAVGEYSKRLSAFCRFSIIELAEERVRSNDPNAAQIAEVLDAEGRRIIRMIGASDYVAAMCIEGKMLSSEELSSTLDKIALGGKSTVDFIIGGSLGLSPEVSRRADLKLSFSAMTFPHQMMRVILLEQIYRSFKIIRHETYHK